METKTIYQALLEAQKKIEPVAKDGNNPYFKSKYSTLGEVIDTIKTELNSVGIFILQPIVDNKVFTSLVYQDGTKIEDGGTPIVCKASNDPQAQGSAITYARRYGLMSLLCLSSEDDDGEKATHASPAPQGQTNIAKPTVTTTSTKKEKEKVGFKLQTKQDGLATARCAKCGMAMGYQEGKKANGGTWTALFCASDEHVTWYPKPEQALNWNELSDVKEITLSKEDEDLISAMPF